MRPKFATLRGRRFGILPMILILVLGLGAGFGLQALRDGGDASPEAAEEDHASELPPGVVEIAEAAQKNAGLETLTARMQTLPATIEVTGNVAAVESKVGHVRALARGVIEDIAVTLGSRVSRGQVLAMYDNIELGELVGSYLGAVGALRQAEADLQVTRRALERAQELIKLEAVAQQTLDLRRAEYRSAEAAVASMRAGVSKVEEQIHRFGLTDADVRRLSSAEDSGHRTASHSALRAPFTGVVTKFDVSNGELVGPDRELMTITDISTVWVLADVYEKDLATIRTGTDVKIRVDAYPDRTFIGQLTYISDVIDPASRTAKVRCVVANPSGDLKLDMFAKVSIPTTENREMLAIPLAAVQQIDGRSVIFIKRGATTFERRNVELGQTAGDLVAVQSGLRAGEVIAGKGSFYLKTAALRDRIGDEH